MRWYFRLALVYVVAFAVVYLSNNYIPSQLANNSGFLLVELLFLLVFGLGAWKAGFLRTIQTRSRLAVVELAVVLAVVACLASAFGTACYPKFCIGSINLRGAYTEYSTFINAGYLTAFGLWLAVAITEEFGFRGYILREISQGMKRRRGTFVALLLSAVAFSFFHVPVLYKSQVGSSEFISFLLGAFAAGVFYGAVYWLTDWNLSISVFLHFFYDAYAVTLNGSQLDPLWTYRINIDFVVLPSIAVIVVHQIVKWQKRARQQKAEPSQEES